MLSRLQSYVANHQWRSQKNNFNEAKVSYMYKQAGIWRGDRVRGTLHFRG